MPGKHFEQLAPEPTCIRCKTHRGTFFPVQGITDALICSECQDKEPIRRMETQNQILIEVALSSLIRVLPISVRPNVFKQLVKAFHPDVGGNDTLMRALIAVKDKFK